MLFLVLSILLSVLLLLNFRIFPRYQINTFQAIVFNYPVCFLTGWLLLPEGQVFRLDPALPWTWLALALGVGFIVTFLLSGASTQRAGITATSLANNLSLVIPVTVSLFIFFPGTPVDPILYVGLALAVVAVGLSTYKKETGPSAIRLSRDALLPLGVFVMYGLTNTAINYLSIRYITPNNPTLPVTLVMVAGAIAAGLVMLAVRLARGTEQFDARSLIGAVTLGIPNFLSFYTLLLALAYFGGNGALVYPLYNIGVILVSAAVATLFFGEKLTPLNRIGLLLAVLAIGLISWQALFSLASGE